MKSKLSMPNFEQIDKKSEPLHKFDPNKKVEQIEDPVAYWNEQLNKTTTDTLSNIELESANAFSDEEAINNPDFDYIDYEWKQIKLPSLSETVSEISIEEEREDSSSPINQSSESTIPSSEEQTATETNNTYTEEVDKEIQSPTIEQVHNYSEKDNLQLENTSEKNDAATEELSIMNNTESSKNISSETEEELKEENLQSDTPNDSSWGEEEIQTNVTPSTDSWEDEVNDPTVSWNEELEEDWTKTEDFNPNSEQDDFDPTIQFQQEEPLFEDPTENWNQEEQKLVSFETTEEPVFIDPTVQTEEVSTIIDNKNNEEVSIPEPVEENNTTSSTVPSKIEEHENTENSLSNETVSPSENDSVLPVVTEEATPDISFEKNLNVPILNEETTNTPSIEITEQHSVPNQEESITEQHSASNQEEPITAGESITEQHSFPNQEEAITPEEPIPSESQTISEEQSNPVIEEQKELVSENEQEEEKEGWDEEAGWDEEDEENNPNGVSEDYDDFDPTLEWNDNQEDTPAEPMFDPTENWEQEENQLTEYDEELDPTVAYAEPIQPVAEQPVFLTEEKTSIAKEEPSISQPLPVKEKESSISFPLHFTSKSDFNIEKNKSPDNEKVSSTIQPSVQDIQTIITNASKQWNMVVPKNNSEKRNSPLFSDIATTLQRKVLPVKINPNNIEAYTRYRGVPIGIVYRPLTIKSSFTIFSLVDNPVKLSISIKRDSDPALNYYQNLVLEQEFSELFSVQVSGQNDIDIANKAIDIFIQKNLVEISPFLHEGDELIINRSGVFMNIQDFRNATELEHTLSIFFLLCENLKLMN